MTDRAGAQQVADQSAALRSGPEAEVRNAAALSALRARLYALIPRLAPNQLEALFTVAEAFLSPHGAHTTTIAPAPPPLQREPAEPAQPSTPAPPQATPRASIEDAPYTLSIPEAAHLLGVSPGSVRKLIQEGRLIPFRHAWRVLLSRTAAGTSDS